MTGCTYNVDYVDLSDLDLCFPTDRTETFYILTLYLEFLRKPAPQAEGAGAAWVQLLIDIDKDFKRCMGGANIKDNSSPAIVYWVKAIRTVGYSTTEGRPAGRPVNVPGGPLKVHPLLSAVVETMDIAIFSTKYNTFVWWTPDEHQRPRRNPPNWDVQSAPPCPDRLRRAASPESTRQALASKRALRGGGAPPTVAPAVAAAAAAAAAATSATAGASLFTAGPSLFHIPKLPTEPAAIDSDRDLNEDDGRDRPKKRRPDPIIDGTIARIRKVVFKTETRVLSVKERLTRDTELAFTRRKSETGVHSLNGVAREFNVPMPLKQVKLALTGGFVDIAKVRNHTRESSLKGGEWDNVLDGVRGALARKAEPKHRPVTANEWRVYFPIYARFLGGVFTKRQDKINKYHGWILRKFDFKDNPRYHNLVLRYDELARQDIATIGSKHVNFGDCPRVTTSGSRRS